MSVEENKALIRQVYDYCNKRELEAYFALFAPGYIFYSVDGDLPLEQAIQHEREWFVAFPDVQSTIMDIVAEDDKVAVRVNWKGTHLGNSYGWTPSGKKVDITNANTFRISDGKLLELWIVCDMHFLLQLGYTKSE